MPRPPRLDFPGARHHVMNRGARRAAVFVSDVVCAMFLDLLAELPDRFGVEVHGYALMPNHFHLMVVSNRGQLSRAMRHLAGVFTLRLNAAEGWDGPIFRGRYRNRLVESDDYWLHLLAYLHLNPVRAHLVGAVADAMWTSHHAYVDRASRPPWLRCEPLLSTFGSVDAYERYVDAVRIGRRPAPDAFDPDALWARAATATFPARPAPVRPSLDGVLADVADITHVDIAALRGRPLRSKHRHARALALWWADHLGVATLTELGQAFGVTRQMVGKVIRSVETSSRSTPETERWRLSLMGRARRPG